MHQPTDTECETRLRIYNITKDDLRMLASKLNTLAEILN